MAPRRKKKRTGTSDHGLASSWGVAFAVFAFLWGVATLFNLLPDLGWDVRGNPLFATRVLTCCAAGWVVLRPTSPWRFFALTCAYTAAIFFEMPVTNNHRFWTLMMNVQMIISFLWLLRSGPIQGRITAADYYRVIVPPLCLSVAVLYFWATFHKLNTGYLTREISAGTAHIHHLASMRVLGLPATFLPTGLWMEYFSIYGTLLIEAALMVLLLCRKTRIVGVVLACFFHFPLGIRYTAFSALIDSMLVLFLPEAFWQSLVRTWKASSLLQWAQNILNPRGWAKLHIWLQVIFIISILVAILTLAPQHMPERWSVSLRHSIWFVYGWVLLLILLRVVFANWREIVAGEKRAALGGALIPLLPRWSVLILPLCFFVNGCSPYVGLKNTLCLAMFSNLRTEDGVSNHLLIPASCRIWKYEDDLVTIHHSSDILLHSLSRPSWTGAPYNANFSTWLLRTPYQQNEPPPTWKLPFIGLRHRVSALAQRGVTGIQIQFERNGKVVKVRNAERIPELANMSWIARKLVRPRAVTSIEEGPCMW